MESVLIIPAFMEVSATIQQCQCGRFDLSAVVDVAMFIGFLHISYKVICIHSSSLTGNHFPCGHWISRMLEVYQNTSCECFVCGSHFEPSFHLANKQGAKSIVCCELIRRLAYVAHVNYEGHSGTPEPDMKSERSSLTAYTLF